MKENISSSTCCLWLFTSKNIGVRRRICRKILCFYRFLSKVATKMTDWEVQALKRRLPKTTNLKSETVINAARRQGVAVETQQKYGGGQNKQHVVTKNTAKLDRETEELKHDNVPLELGKLIMQARQGKGMSQKDLATKICEKPQVVNDYEAGRGIPNNVVIGKMERALGVKLRGKDRGRAVQPPGAKK